MGTVNEPSLLHGLGTQSNRLLPQDPARLSSPHSGLAILAPHSTFASSFPISSSGDSEPEPPLGGRHTGHTTPSEGSSGAALVSVPGFRPCTPALGLCTEVLAVPGAQEPTFPAEGQFFPTWPLAALPSTFSVPKATVRPVLPHSHSVPQQAHPPLWVAERGNSKPSAGTMEADSRG